MPSDVTNRLINAVTDNLTNHSTSNIKFWKAIHHQKINLFLFLPSKTFSHSSKQLQEKKSCANRGKTRNLIKTPEKNEIMTNVKKKKKTRRKICERIITVSNESDFEEAPSPLLSDEEDCLNRSLIENEKLSKVTKPRDIKDNEFVLIRLRAKIVYDMMLDIKVVIVFEDGNVTFEFLKRSYHPALLSEHPTFIFPENTNDASKFIENLENIVVELPVPLKKRN